MLLSTWKMSLSHIFSSKTSWACIYRILHGRTERFNCGQQAGGSFLEGGTTASFTFDITTLRIAALMHTRSISNVFRSYLQRWNRLSNRKPMSTCYFIRFLTRCCLLLQECLAEKSSADVIIALIITIDSPGAPIFKQERLGINGKPFMIYKFRSMRLDAEENGPPSGRTNRIQDARTLAKSFGALGWTNFPSFITSCEAT